MDKNTEEIIIFFSIGGTIGALTYWKLPPAGIIRSLAEPVYDEKFLGESQMSTAEYLNVFEERNQVSTTKLPSETELYKGSIVGVVVLSPIVVLAITRLSHQSELSPLENFFPEENQIDLYNG